MVGIAADCNNVLKFLQEISLKAPQVLMLLLLLRADKRAIRWFCQWSYRNLKHHATLHRTAPQYNSGLKGVLSEVEMRLQNAEALSPAIET